MGRGRDDDAFQAVLHILLRLTTQSERAAQGVISTDEFWAALERGILELARMADAEHLVKDRI